MTMQMAEKTAVFDNQSSERITSGNIQDWRCNERCGWFVNNSRLDPEDVKLDFGEHGPLST